MFLLLSVSVAFGQTAGGVLFNDVGVSAAGLDSNSGPEVVRERRVIINFGALSAPLPGASVDSGLEADSDLASGGSDLQGEPLQLNIFSDVALPVVFERTEGNSSGSRTWYGAVQNVPDSSVILVTNGGVMVGNIVVGTAIYQVRYLDGGVHVVREIDQSAFPPEGEPAQVDNPPDPHDDVTHLDSSPEGDTVVMDGRTTDKVIDVLVAYTTAAKNGEGGTLAMQNIIDLAIAESNIGYANSGITQRLNLVHTVEVSYTESGYLEQDRHRLQQPADGYMDNIHTLRNIYKADVVTLIVNNGDWCGMAYIMETVALSFEEYAFNVVRRTCAVGSYVFAHEIGHIMGARHDWYVDDSANQPYSYNHAYFNTTEKKRSIMAYNNGCDAVGGCTRLNYWSNPDRGPVSPWGVREGTSTSCTTGVPNPDCDADNRKTLNNTGFVVANFRVRDATATPSREFSSGAAPDIVADGVMFDLKAKETTTIHGFSSAFSSAGTVSRIEIYYRAGSYNLFDSFPSAWKLVGSVNDVEVQAAPAETHIPIDLDITIPAGQTFSFYITRAGPGPPYPFYSNGTSEGALYAANDQLELYQGRGKIYPFFSSFYPRVFCGTVYHAYAKEISNLQVSAVPDNFYQNGIMFDVRVLRDLTLHGFSPYIYGVGWVPLMHVYYRRGTHVGYEHSWLSWSRAGSVANVVATPPHALNRIPLEMGIAMKAGETYGFYVTTTGSPISYGISSKEGTGVGNVFASNGDLELLEGTAKVFYPFGTGVAPRGFPCIVHYHVRSRSSPFKSFSWPMFLPAIIGSNQE